MEEELENKLFQMSLCPPQLMVCPKRSCLFNQIYINQVVSLNYIRPGTLTMIYPSVGKNAVLLTIIKAFSIHLRK